MKKSLYSLLIFFLFSYCTPQTKTYIRNENFVFGTTYHLIYEHSDDLKQEIDLTLKQFNNSLSTYDTASIISKVNRNVPVKVDAYFKKVFTSAQQITIQTNGAFDMTVAPLVNAWGFGFTHKDSITPILIDSLLSNVGMSHITLLGNQIIKDNPHTMLDASAIAKGYGVDVVAELLESKGIVNYMVEIGGEMRVKGKSPKGVAWKIGIDKPIDDPAVTTRALQQIIQLSTGAMATSGNYRNFYIKDGQKYAHTINPINGYPVNHNLLGVSVIAPTCMRADAFATAFMVLGVDKSLEIIKLHPEIEAYFISSNNDEDYIINYTKGFEQLIIK